MRDINFMPGDVVTCVGDSVALFDGPGSDKNLSTPSKRIPEGTVGIVVAAIKNDLTFAKRLMILTPTMIGWTWTSWESWYKT
jgi:hypothetical protein